MKKYLKIGFIVCVITQLGACSMAQLTVRASMPMIEGGITAMNEQTDLVDIITKLEPLATIKG